MRSSRAIGATATLLAVLAASACGGGSSGGSTDSSSSASSTRASQGIASGESTPPQTTTSSASKSPTTKAKPTSTGTAAGAPGVPEPARQHTKAGAEAFVAYYLRVMNTAAEKPTPKPLAPISAPGCKTCREWTEVFTTLIKDKTHYDRAVFEQPNITRTLAIDTNSYHLFFNLRQSAANIRHTEGGKITDPGKTSSMKVVFELKWTKQGWRTLEVQQNA